jgi:tetratricopeptide (TPR) repeat protein
VIGIVATAIQARRAQAEADKRASTISLLISMPLAQDVRFASNPKLAALLEDIAVTVVPDLEPMVARDVLDRIGVLYYYGGRYDRCEPHFRRQIELNREHLGDGHTLTLRSVGLLASALLQQGKFDEADAELRNALAPWGWETGPRDDRPDDDTMRIRLLALTATRGRALSLAGRADEGERVLRETLRRQEAFRELNPTDYLDTMVALSLLLHERGKDLDEAVTLLEHVLEKRSALTGGNAPLAMGVEAHLGRVLTNAGRLEEAETHVGRAWQWRRREFGSDHRLSLLSQVDFARLRLEQGRFGEAEGLYLEALGLMAGDPNVAWQMPAWREEHRRCLEALGRTP